MRVSFCVPAAIFLLLVLGMEAMAQTTTFFRPYMDQGRGGFDGLAYSYRTGNIMAINDVGFFSGLNVVSLDSLGNIRWSYVHQHVDTAHLINPFPRVVYRTKDDGGFTMGKALVFNGVVSCTMGIRYDSTGKILWERFWRHGGASTENGGAAVHTQDGGFVLASDAYVWEDTTVDRDTAQLIVRKIDGMGELQWERSFLKTLRTMTKSVAEDKKGGLLIVGDLTSGTVNTIPFYLKLSANGEMEWYKQWVNDTIISNGQQVGDAIATLDGDFVVSALNITYKIRSKDGAVLWGTKKIVDNMVELPDGSLILNSGLYLSKLTSDGKIIWKNRKYWEVDELNSRVGHNRVYVAPDGGILLGGDIRPEINPLLIKLDCEGNSVNTITCQRPVVSQMVEPLEEILVFPNPSSEWLYISLPPDISSPFSFVLYNALGQVVRHIEFEQGQKEQKVDIRGLAQGVYFYQCTSHFHPISKGKLLLTKTD